MKRLLALALVAAFSLAGCSVSDVKYVHDDARGVGCWYFSAGGVSCIPDKEYAR